MNRIIRFFIVFLCFGFTSAFANNTFWQLTGGPFGGQVNAVLVANNGNVFLATDGNGVWVSLDEGNTWQHKSTGFAEPIVHTLLQTMNGDLYAGTNNGLFYSNDGGQNWDFVETGAGAVITGLVQTNDKRIFGITNSGVFRSDVNGTNFETANTGIGVANGTCIATLNGIDLWAGTGLNALYKSTNAGDSWSKVDGTFGNYAIKAIAKTGTGRILVANLSGVYFSDDDGATWGLATAGLSNPGVNDIFIQDDGTILLAAKLGIYSSTDNGDSWNDQSAGLVNNQVFDLDQHNGSYIYAAGGAGMHRSFDNATSWHGANYGLINTEITEFATNEAILLAGSLRSGVYRSLDGGKTWYPKNSGLPANEAWSLLHLNDGSWLVGAGGYGLYRSTDDAENWSKSNNGFPPEFLSTSDLLQDENGVLFAAHGDGVYRSEDNAATWVQVGLAGKEIALLAAHSQAGLFAGESNGGIWRADVNGENWTTANNGLETTAIHAILLVDETKMAYVGTNKGLFKMGFEDNYWDLVAFSGKVVEDLTFNKYGHLFAAVQDAGVYFSADAGTSWKLQDTGLTNKNPWVFAWSDADNLWLGTGGGVYRHDTSENADALFAPAILSVKDVPNDQGGFVIVKWQKSLLDEENGPIDYYSIWRALPEDAAANFNQSGFALSKQGKIITEGNLAWEWIVDRPAHGFETYSYTAKTLYDSTELSKGVHHFLVSAHSQDWNFYDSQSGSGYSVDNIAPGIPQNFTAYLEDDAIILKWQPVMVDDLDEYVIYRHSSPLFALHDAESSFAATDTSYVDTEATPGQSWYYMVAARDIHGNLSAASAVQEVIYVSTGIEADQKVPDAFSLKQNHPNPFNPSTTISYQLPKTSDVTIRIYDVMGQLVREYQMFGASAGEHRVIWDGLNEAGKQVAGGLYIYRMQAGNFSATMKMVYLR